MSTIKFKWSGISGWEALGLLALLIGVVWFIRAAPNFNRWLYTDRYVAADLLVTRFKPDPIRSRHGHLIEGVIQPGGELVVTSDRYIGIRQFVDPTDTTGRRVPTSGELEGKHLAVWYWPGHADVARWWHPPTVVMPEAIHGGIVVRDVLVGWAFLAAAFFCFARGNKKPKEGSQKQ